MSPDPSTQRALEWLEQQLTDLNGIRNATPRDPSFKNWRQATLTTLQRIWPGDQERSERFRRIPFSPVDPRADARATREWYSRGCQEATRVINGFIEDARKNGVPEQVLEIAPDEPGKGFEDDFPVVDLPAGDLGAAAPSPASANTLSEFVDAPPQAPTADSPAPPSLGSNRAPEPEVHAHDQRQSRKGVGARLKDLLGFAQLSAKALTGQPRSGTAGASLPSMDAPMSAPPPSLDVMPVGGAVSNDRGRVPPLPAAPAPEDSGLAAAPRAHEPRPDAPPSLSVPLSSPGSVQPGSSMSGLWPLPKQPDAAVGGAPQASEPAAPAEDPPATAQPRAAEQVPYEPGKSVVMSRPTTLRRGIEKVSIESLLSEQFREPAAAEPATPAAAEVEPEVPVLPEPELDSPAPVPTAEPPAPAVSEAPPELPELLEQMAAADAQARDAAAGTPEPTDAPDEPADGEPDVVPEPEEAPPRSARGARSNHRVVQIPQRRRTPRAEAPPPEVDSDDDSAVGKVDPDAFARATEDFMRSSPVLGATGRKVRRANEDTGFNDPDAIAVASMMQELGRLDVPAGRQPEVRARLLDLARRVEQGELDWTALRKAVWFAMEYPEIARRLMPVLLPWIDRAA